MYKYLLVLITLLPLSVSAEEKVTTFHRLLIFNDHNELLVVKIKGRGFWVTPGWYQDANTMLHNGLKKTALDYGLTISNTKLRGMFTLKDQQDTSLSMRNFFTMNSADKVSKMPKYIEEIKWLPVEEAKKIMTFPHINLLLDQVMQHPSKIRTGGIYRYIENDKNKIEIIEAFQSVG